MIAKGGDCLSFGATNKGVMSKEYFLFFLPLHQSSINPSSTLQGWIQS